MNFPLPAGSGRAEILGAVQDALMPAAERFRPGPGADLGGLRFPRGRSAGPIHADRRRFRRSDARDDGDSGMAGWFRVLEGGYSLDGLASAAAAHVAVLAE